MCKVKTVTLHSVAFHLVLHCLPKYPFRALQSSGSELDLRSKGHWFETHPGGTALSKPLYPLLYLYWFGNCPNMTEKLLTGV